MHHAGPGLPLRHTRASDPCQVPIALMGGKSGLLPLSWCGARLGDRGTVVGGLPSGSCSMRRGHNRRVGGQQRPPATVATGAGSSSMSIRRLAQKPSPGDVSVRTNHRYRNGRPSTTPESSTFAAGDWYLGTSGCCLTTRYVIFTRVQAPFASRSGLTRAIGSGC
jgi:hypothetical protein